MWVFVYKSGIHVTLVGVITALAIALSDDNGGHPLERAEHALQPWVAFAVLPMFAFVNAGVSLQGLSPDTLLQSVPIGIGARFVVGNAVGVFGASMLLVRFSGAAMPAGANWALLFGVCVLCGVGFTMSLFIGRLAFDGLDDSYVTQLKIGVLAGSLVAGVIGSLVLLRSKTSAERVTKAA